MPKEKGRKAKGEERMNGPKVFGTHEFWIPEGSGCSVEVELDDHPCGDLTSKDQKPVKMVNLSFLTDSADLELSITLPTSVFRRLMSLGQNIPA